MDCVQGPYEELFASSSVFYHLPVTETLRKHTLESWIVSTNLLKEGVVLWPLPQNRKNVIFGNGVTWGDRLLGELLEETESGKARILVELDRLCWRIPAVG